ncbi:hypothetical protein BD309DRAFT_717190 [Dichomitus squalens]|nr:hypothetical protein BD309DRAFT_717190 [Dichomitus squalens]
MRVWRLHESQSSVRRMYCPWTMFVPIRVTLLPVLSPRHPVSVDVSQNSTAVCRPIDGPPRRLRLKFASSDHRGRMRVPGQEAQREGAGVHGSPVDLVPAPDASATLLSVLGSCTSKSAHLQKISSAIISGKVPAATDRARMQCARDRLRLVWL